MTLWPPDNQKGVVLILTLTIVTILVTVTFELNRQMQSSVLSAAVVRDRVLLDHMIDSAVEVAKGILIADKNDSEIDSVQEDWAVPEKIDAYLAGMPFEQGEVGLMITDELSRVQVNALVQFPDGKDYNTAQRDLWLRFISLMLAQQEDARQETAELFTDELPEPGAVINPIKDWLDDNDNDAITGLDGAENEYYEDLDPPYKTRNGPIRYVEELVRTKGITPELFYTLNEEVMGISNFVTVHGLAASGDKFTYTGKININTAEMPVLAGLLPLGHEFLAPEIYNYRIEKAEERFLYDLTGAAWYKQVPGCSEVDIPEELITTQSDLFRIECFATVNDVQKIATVIVERQKDAESGKWYCKLLRRQYE